MGYVEGVFTDERIDFIEEQQVNKAGVNFVGTVIAGYKVVKQGKDALLATNESRVDPWVAWSYKVSHDGEIDAYWGRYGCKNSAVIAFNKKEGELTLEVLVKEVWYRLDMGEYFAYLYIKGDKCYLVDSDVTGIYDIKKPYITEALYNYVLHGVEGVVEAANEDLDLKEIETFTRLIEGQYEEYVGEEIDFMEIDLETSLDLFFDAGEEPNRGDCDAK